VTLGCDQVWQGPQVVSGVGSAHAPCWELGVPTLRVGCWECPRSVLGVGSAHAPTIVKRQLCTWYPVLKRSHMHRTVIYFRFLSWSLQETGRFAFETSLTSASLRHCYTAYSLSADTSNEKETSGSTIPCIVAMLMKSFFSFITYIICVWIHT
jgi:hypothetical protein